MTETKNNSNKNNNKNSKKAKNTQKSAHLYSRAANPVLQVFEVNGVYDNRINHDWDMGQISQIC